MCFPYLAALIARMQVNVFFEYVLWSFVTIIGFAGFAYTLNDLGDVSIDQKAKKDNAVLNLGTFKTVILLLFCLLVSLVPWLFLPHSKYSFLLLFLELCLFYLYALKPFRLKERGLLGLLCDALYAHCIPAVLAFYTFSDCNLESNKTLILLVIVFFWQLMNGLRNIVFHQLNDYNNDFAGGVNTWVKKRGLGMANIAAKGLLIAEAFSFLLFLVMLAFAFNISVLHIALLCFLCYLLIKHRNNLRNLSMNELKFIFFDQFYLYWFPLLLLVLLLKIDLIYSVMFFIHFMLFQNAIKPWLLFKINAFKKLF
ncbi:MAG: UbiA family prenyltransferase [Bacteroidota bacterium]